MTYDEYLRSPKWRNPKITELRKQNKFIYILKHIGKYLYRDFCYQMSGKNIEISYKRRNRWDKLYISNLLNDYRHKVAFSEGYGKKIPIRNSIWIYNIDAGIAQAIFALNKLGVSTSFCCEGNHIKGHSSTAYILLDYKQKFPQELIDMLNTNKVGYNFRKPSEKNPYHHGESLHADNFIKDNDNFLKTLQQWAEKQGVAPLHKLKHQWKKFEQFS